MVFDNLVYYSSYFGVVMKQKKRRVLHVHLYKFESPSDIVDYQIESF